ncbi:hypothetical protein HK096_009076, partial [Nowakowskiella sp. JEL0078]
MKPNLLRLSSRSENLLSHDSSIKDQYYFPDSESTFERLSSRVTNQDVGRDFKFAVTNSPKLSGDNFTSFYGLADKKTAVWVFPTFDPEGITLSDGSILPLTAKQSNQWIDDIILGLGNLQKSGYTKLIIDVSQNGGGLICVAQAIGQIPINDMRYTELLLAIGKASSTFKQGFFTPDGKVPLTANTNWFSQRSTSPDSTQGTYTQQYKSTNCDLAVTSTLQQYMNTTGIQPDFWKPENMAILSDGTCGSACSFLTRGLHTQKKVPVYVYGGLTDNGKSNIVLGVKGTPFQWCGFDGGPVIPNEFAIRSEVFPIRSLLPSSVGSVVPGSAASWVNLIAPNNITLFPLQINWTIPISATYQPSKLNRMTEWFFEPATDLVNVLNSFEDRSTLWVEVSTRMDKKLPGSVSSHATQN